jgi:hypothetical protein
MQKKAMPGTEGKRSRMKYQGWFLLLLMVIVAGSTACDTLPDVNPVSASTPTPEASFGRTVALADDGQTITMHVGESFLLKLGQAYEWTVVPLDQNIIRREPNVLTIIGSQGLYQAYGIGRSQVTAVGEPFCHQSQPPCEIPSRGFVVDVVVE